VCLGWVFQWVEGGKRSTHSSCSGKKYAEGSCNTSKVGARSSVTFGSTGTDGEEISCVRSMARTATRCWGLVG